MTQFFKSWALIYALINFSATAHATLGETRARQQVALKASQVVVDEQNPCYSVQTLNFPHSTVKEFINRDSGKVFRVTWAGARHPDFKAFFGASHSDFMAAQKANPPQTLSRNHREDANSHGDFSYRLSTGHRIQHGSATLKSLVPSCVSNPRALE
jgi:hypothetical protein